MKSKSIFITAAIAIVSSAAFAQVPAATPANAPATETVQVAQAITMGAGSAAFATGRTTSVATSNCTKSFNDAGSMIVCTQPDSRTRAQVQAEARAWKNSPEAKAARELTLGAF